MCSRMNVGKMPSGVGNVLACDRSAHSPTPTMRNSVNCTNTTMPLPMIARCASLSDSRREQALHDQLVGAVRRHGQERAADQAREHRVRLVEHRSTKSMHLQLPGRAARGR